MRSAPSRSVMTPDGLVVALRPLNADAPWIGAWRDLGGRPLLDNLFYHPDFALPAAGPFGKGVQVALVGDRAPEEPGLRLHAVWPLRSTRLRWGLPLFLAMGWMHGFGSSACRCSMPPNRRAPSTRSSSACAASSVPA